MNDFRQVHRATPLLKFWRALFAIAVIVLFNFSGTILRYAQGAIHEAFLPIAVLVVASALVWGLSNVWWKAYGYRMDGEELAVRHGVIQHQLRTARYTRIQGVDVVEDFLPRVFGLAAVRVETAGGSDSALEIAYLPLEQAQQLRQEVLGYAQRAHANLSTNTTASGASVAPTSTAIDGAPGAVTAGTNGVEDTDPIQSAGISGETFAPHPTQQEHTKQQAHPARQLIPEIPTMRSLVAAALSLSTISTLIVLLIVGFTPLGWSFTVPYLLGVGPRIWNIIDHSWRYSATQREGVLHIRYGLADRRSQNIALDRIHAIELSQPPLWRLVGWWQVKVNVAGYGVSKASGSTLVLPVGDRELAESLIDHLLPLPQAPQQWGAPARAKWISPWGWRNQGGYRVGDTLVVTRGFFVRRVAAVDVSHVQELTLLQGPVARVLGLASVRCDLVQGKVRMTLRELDEQQAWEVFDQLRRRRLPALGK